MKTFVWIWALCMLGTVQGFHSVHLYRPGYIAFSGAVRRMTTDENPEKELRDEAEMLLSKARQLRLEIGAMDERRESPDNLVLTGSKTGTVSVPWLLETGDEGDGYRLYIDIGREDGTWMEPRWGASGRRIRFTLDVKFLTKNAPEEMSVNMVKDNYMGKSSNVRVVATANEARLRDGFDRMRCHGGCYRIDSAGGKDTIRFFVEVDGTTPEQAFGYVASCQPWQDSNALVDLTQLVL